MKQQYIDLFHHRIEKMIEDSKIIGYMPTYFIRMVQELGAVATCQQLLHDNKIHDGLIKLWKLNRLDLTIEKVILEPEWKELFSEADLELAKNKLIQLGYKEINDEI